MSTMEAVMSGLSAGLPVLLLHFVATLGLLAAGGAAYMAITPFDERRLVAEGNVAAGVVMAGAIIGLSVPLAATLATSGALLDILLWGVVAVLLQLVALGASGLVVRDLRARIEAGNVAAALPVLGIQLAVALLNAAAMAG